MKSEIDFPFEIFLLPELKLILKGKKMIPEVKKNIQKFLKLAEVKSRNYKHKYCEMSVYRKKQWFKLRNNRN